MRWTPKRKKQLLDDLAAGKPIEHDFSGEELEAMAIHFAQRGLNGLKATRIQEGRNVRD